MDIEKILKNNNKRITSERVSIYDFLKTKHIFTYNDIILNFKDISRASVFRTINLFLELKIIRKVEIWDNAMTYEIIDEENHHEHMKCEKCNSIINFDSRSICNKIFCEAEKMWFKIKSHNIWVTWICNKCL